MLTETIRDRFLAAPTFDEYLATTEKNRDLWHTMSRLARVPDDLAARAAAVPGRWHLLVLSEDWCGDAVNTVPILARLAELVPSVELRVLGRDANPDLMDAHLSPGGARAIPVVMVLDEEFEEQGWWGSRPGQLQEWFDAVGRSMTKEERYPLIRQWYARDRGRTTVEEVVALMERGAAVEAG